MLLICVWIRLKKADAVPGAPSSGDVRSAVPEAGGSDTDSPKNDTSGATSGEAAEGVGVGDEPVATACPAATDALA